MTDDDEPYLIALLGMLPWCTAVPEQAGVTFEDGSTPRLRQCGPNAYAMVRSSPDMGIRHGWLAAYDTRREVFVLVGHVLNTGANNRVEHDSPDTRIGQVLDVTPLADHFERVGFIPDVQPIAVWNARKLRTDRTGISAAVHAEIVRQVARARALYGDGVVDPRAGIA